MYGDQFGEFVYVHWDLPAEVLDPALMVATEDREGELGATLDGTVTLT